MNMPLNQSTFRRCIAALVVFALSLQFSAIAFAQSDAWFDKQTQWHGEDQFHFRVADRSAYLIVPQQPLPGNPWIWRARFPGFHDEADVKLVAAGFHLAYVDVAGMFGSPRAMAIGDAFYDFLTTKRKLSQRVVMEGVSRGGLLVYNWSARHPDRVTCIYCDTPVCDFKSWPGGKGAGIGSAGTWQSCLAEYGFDEAAAMEFKGNPIDHAAKIAAAKIPILHIVSDNDRVVPPAENTDVLHENLKKAGHSMQTIRVPEGTAKSSGHHFTHPAVDQVVAFIMQHGK